MSKQNFQVEDLVRDHIRDIQPYPAAQISDSSAIRLDSNENMFGSPLKGVDWDLLRGQPLNYYPDPSQEKLKERLAFLKAVKPANIFFGNGSDELIDRLIRVLCEPGLDKILICPPTFGMYAVCSAMNHVEVINVPLNTSFQLDIDLVLESLSPRLKIIFICSPNNPTGNLVKKESIVALLDKFPGIVVIDEAYIDYASQESFVSKLSTYPNLVVLQTFSKAWGLASLRLGMAYASVEIIQLLTQLKYPYNISGVTQSFVLRALENGSFLKDTVSATLEQRDWLARELSTLPYVKHVYPSHANFLLVQMKDAKRVFRLLTSKGIHVRDRSSEPLCHGCLRITVGTGEQNRQLIKILKTFHYEKNTLY